MTDQRRTILYTGRVQGVGFRWTSLRALQGFPVTGYVRNLDDGRVELVVEGAPEQTRMAAESVRDALARHIASETVTVGPTTGEFTGLEIRA